MRSSPSVGVSPRSSTSTGSSSSTDRQQRREVAHVLLELVEDRGDPPLAEPHPRADALRLEFLGTGVGGLLEQRDARLAPQLLAEQERRVRARARPARRRCTAPRSRSRAYSCGLTCRWNCTLVHAASGAIVSAEVASRSTPSMLIVDVLAARLEDLLVDQRVARVRAQRLVREVLGAQRRQDADHDDVRAPAAERVLGVVEAGAQVAVSSSTAFVPASTARRHVDLDVELAEFGLEVVVGDRVEHVGVAHRRVAVLVDEVELDLEPGHRPVERRTSTRSASARTRRGSGAPWRGSAAGPCR